MGRDNRDTYSGVQGRKTGYQPPRSDADIKVITERRRMNLMKEFDKMDYDGNGSLTK